MNCLSTSKRVQVISALVEGVSVNAIVRMTGISKVTILKLLKEIGCACAEYHEKHIRNVTTRRVQCDEIWSFVYAKQKNVSEEQMNAGAGDCWTWIAIDADTKLVISYMLGQRGLPTAMAGRVSIGLRQSNQIFKLYHYREGGDFHDSRKKNTRLFQHCCRNHNKRLGGSAGTYDARFTRRMQAPKTRGERRASQGGRVACAKLLNYGLR
jgi:hypothetical protein